jgi:hypothetical protein
MKHFFPSSPVVLVYRVVSALQLSEMPMSRDCGLKSDQQMIASYALSTLNVNLGGEKSCGLFSVERKLFKIGSGL